MDWECDILLTDLRMPVMNACASVETAVEAMKFGADDYLTKPLSFEAVEIIIARAMERLALRHELEELRAKKSAPSRTIIIGNSPPVQEVINTADQVGPSRATVLITGESGTGKELVARLIHERSNRADKPTSRASSSAMKKGPLPAPPDAGKAAEGQAHDLPNLQR